MGGGREDVGEFRLAKNVDDENDQNQGKKAADDLEHAAGSPPATAFLVVKNWLAFNHSDNPS